MSNQIPKDDRQFKSWIREKVKKIASTWSKDTPESEFRAMEYAVTEFAKELRDG
jgi:hypothetical protein